MLFQKLYDPVVRELGELRREGPSRDQGYRQDGDYNGYAPSK